ncbi:MAG TPA: response regulator [Caproiciproducens sp.]|nr:response regulator [Caproiciproducens sp.]
MMIRALLVDDELPALEEMEYQLRKFDTVEIAGSVQGAGGVLDALAELKPDAVFLDIDMPGTNGLELALKIQELHAGIVIIFVTAYSQYALEAFKAYPLDYILKPASERRLAKTIAYLKEQLDSRRPQGHHESKACIRCFGNFEVFSGGDEKLPVKFATRQAREMLAYLICHYEETVTREELIQNIFGGGDDKKTVNLLHVTAYNLRRTLGALDTGGSISITGNYTFHASDGVCDYIDFVKFNRSNPYVGTENIRKAEEISGLYRGTYLQAEDYLWAEEIRTELELQYEKLLLKISNYYSDTGNVRESEKTLVMLVAENPLSDTGNRALLELYMREGNAEKFRGAYKAYAKLLKQELQTKPDAEFRNFFQENC